MTNLTELRPKRMLTGRLDHGSDLLNELTAICESENITLGQIRAIGAVQKACIGFYDQQKQTYMFKSLDKDLEIAQLIGNVSLKDGKPFVHAHITLSDEEGRAFGGHLAEGTIIFACEVFIEIFDGPALERGYDETTGLGLWQ